MAKLSMTAPKADLMGAEISDGSIESPILQTLPYQTAIVQRSIRAPAEYLSDEKGIYGLRINHHVCPSTINIRPDKLVRNDLFQFAAGAWLHCEPRKTKEHSLESSLGYTLTQTIMHQKYPQFKDVTRPSELSPEDRRKFFAVPWYSKRIINGMWKKVLLSADQEALKLARRFHIAHRGIVYYHAATSLRAKQLFEAFPALGVASYKNVNRFNFNRVDSAKLVEDGCKLKDIAYQLNIPLLARKIKPGAVHALSTNLYDLFRSNPSIVHDFLPEATMEQFRWLCVLSSNQFDAIQWKQWLAKNAPTKMKIRELIAEAQTIRDWFLANHVGDLRVAANFPTCNWNTAKERSAEWHRTAAERYARQNALLNEQARLEALRPFPEPWLPGLVKGDLEILPLTTAAMLEEEGTRMHHCVAGYAHYVKRGHSYIYSVRKEGKSIATFELAKSEQSISDYNAAPGEYLEIRFGGIQLPVENLKIESFHRYGIRQLKGPCNVEVHHSIKGFVNSWLEEGNRRCQENSQQSSPTLPQVSEVGSYSDLQPAPLFTPGLPA